MSDAMDVICVPLLQSALTSGVLTGSLMLWIAFGSNLANKYKYILPTVTDNCSTVLGFNDTNLYSNTTDPFLSPTGIVDQTYNFPNEQVWTTAEPTETETE